MRKSYIKLILPLMLAIFTWSCKEESNLEPEGQWTLSSPISIAPLQDAALVLDESKPNATVNFEWSAAASSANYGITYSIVIDTLGSTNFDSPILEVKASSNGKGLTASIAYNILDEALSFAGYPANAIAQVSWAVKASCLSRSSFAINNISIKRFATEIIPTQLYISGEATEAGVDLSKAIQLKRLNGAGGKISNKFEIYTSLVTGKSYKFYSAKSLPAHQYGGSDSILVKSGQPILAATSGVYRISLDMDKLTCSLLKIERMGVIGESFANGWNSDVALDYQGGGVWKGTIEVVAKKDFAFRANESWDYVYKRVKHSTNKVILEAQATIEVDSVENIPTDKIGVKIFTLDLSAGAYTYLIEKDPNSPNEIVAPSTLFLLAGGKTVVELTKNGNVFTSPVYVALQASVIYTLNSKADGTGTSYALDSKIGTTATLGGDAVSGLGEITEEAANIGVEYDQAFSLSIDFEATKLAWSYYNLKLFHWSKWDTRLEIPMTYVHPFTFTLTTDITAGEETKFNSPWAVQFGVVLANGDVATALSGTTTNADPSDNFKCITTTGSYDASLTFDNMYKFGTYSFTAH